MQMVGEHHVDVLVVLPAQHRVKTFDLPGKECHAFVAHGLAVQRGEFETKEIGRFEKLGLDLFAVIGGEGS